MRDPASLAAHPIARRAIPTLLLAIMAVLLVSSSLHKRLVYDEYDNLSYGYRFLTKGAGVAPEGQRMPVLVLSALPCAAEGCQLDDVNNREGLRLAVRAGSMLFAVALAVIVWRWAGQLLGPVGALAALWLAVFDPTVLAHGKQVTSDVAVTAFMVAAVYGYWRYGQGGRRWTLVAVGAATAGAILSKFTGLLLVPVLGLLATLDLARAWRSGTRPTRRSVGRVIGTVVAMALFVVFLINAAYLFHGSFRPASDYRWRSQAFQQRATSAVPIPLPRVFVQGLDYSSFLQENPERARGYNYVLGRLSLEGVWYAFPLMVLLKTPLAVFVLAALGLRARVPSGAGAGPGMAALLAIPFAAVMLFFSLAVDAQLGIRYVLPALPFLTLAAARGAADLGGHRRWLVPLLLVWHAGSTLSYHPHFIPYFNELIGRRVNAYRYLADSNLDWEDHAWWIAAFRRAHPDVALHPPTPRPGWILVGANDLVGILDPERYRWLREGFTPLGHVAYAHLLFYVPPERLGAAPSPSPPPP